MTSITLNKRTIYTKNQTTKYWREVECPPQTANLKTWSTNHPLFILSGTIVNSHDPKEIGQREDVYVQTYSFYLEPKIKEKVYTINNFKLKL